MSDNMREEFEAWVVSRGYPTEKSPYYPGEYRLDSVQYSWTGYGQAWQHQQAVIDKKEELLAEQEMTISNYMDINEAAGKENEMLKAEIAQLRAKINEATDIAISNNNVRMEEIDQLRDLLGRGYGKLIRFGVQNTDPMLMDEIKLELMK